MSDTTVTTRATHLDRVQMQRLCDWARIVRTSFPRSHGPYLVGSARTRPDWRDVDVRLILPDDAYDALAAVVNVDRLGFAIALWGQRATELPIDFQIQRMTEANERHPGKRHPLGMESQLNIAGDGGPTNGSRTKGRRR